MPADQPRRREIRVFISSTFRDMQEEREELVKQIFPQLRRLCESRGVTWGEVDLRWGVPDEAKAEGKVLPLCLAEIERCRPYFIGLLGERYGWAPEEIPEELVERQPWLAEHRKRSVTELEILHGVLNKPEMARHAFFYFRDPAYPDGLPPEKEEKAERLRALKDRIRRSGLPVREDYLNPKVLGELVYKDLRGVIESRFPPQALDPLDRDAADHEAFAQSRARVYIGRQEYFDRIEAHAAEPLVVVGESGVGKSALLANWALRYGEKHPDELVLIHFIGATPYSGDWAAMLRRILGEFRRRLGIELEIPDKPDALRLTFVNALRMAAARGRVALIIDALDQLEDRNGAPDLVWLPPVIPVNVRLVVSTLPGRPLEDLKKRGWPVLEVKPLTPAERRQLIREYLAQHTKTLSESRVERIAAAEQASNPLYLRALLEELRVFGVHERLDDRITHYLAASSIPKLYERILERWEEDYERERPCLVHDAMTLIWAARRGLSEAELLELLGAGGQPLPRARWSPLYLTAEQVLVSRSGLIGFFHEYSREAVRNRYLPTEQEQQQAHLRLADYFEARELGPRRVDELPWQLAEAAQWQRLFDLLAGSSFFVSAWDANQFDLKTYWGRVEASSPLRMERAYWPVLDRADEADGDLLMVSRLTGLFRDTGRLALAKRCCHKILSCLQGVPMETAGHVLAGVYQNLASLEMASNNREASERWLGRSRLLSPRVGESHEALNILVLAGLRAKKRGEWSRALELYDEAIAMARQLNDCGTLARLYNNLGNVEKNVNLLPGATEHFELGLALARTEGDLETESRCCHGLGDAASMQRDFPAAQRWYANALEIKNRIGDREGMAKCCLGLGNIALIKGDWKEAALHYDRAMDFAPDNKELLLAIYENKAKTLCSQQSAARPDDGEVSGEVMEYFWRCYGLRRELGLDVPEYLREIFGIAGTAPDSVEDARDSQFRTSGEGGEE